MGVKRRYKGQGFWESDNAYRQRRKNEKAFQKYLRDVGKLSKLLAKLTADKPKSRAKARIAKTNRPLSARSLTPDEQRRQMEAADRALKEAIYSSPLNSVLGFVISTIVLFICLTRFVLLFRADGVPSLGTCYAVAAIGAVLLGWGLSKWVNEDV